MQQSDSLSRTLALLAERMTFARDPWWVIGSAAVALHGCQVSPRDVDVLLSVADARALLDNPDISALDRDGDELFRSQIYAEWKAPPVRVEFMAGLRVRGQDGWQAVAPLSREPRHMEGRTVYVPDRADLLDILASFGRPKDRKRYALLEGLHPSRKEF